LRRQQFERHHRDVGWIIGWVIGTIGRGIGIIVNGLVRRPVGGCRGLG